VVHRDFVEVTEKYCPKFDSAAVFYDHGKNLIQHESANVYLITRPVGVLAFGSDAQLLLLKCTTLLTCIENSYFSFIIIPAKMHRFDFFLHKMFVKVGPPRLLIFVPIGPVALEFYAIFCRPH
jgi:hypothetical protein